MLNITAVRRLWERLSSLRRVMLEGMSSGLPALAALDLTVPQSMVIFRLVQSGPATISELCATSGRSQGATSSLVAKLEKRGLVKRKGDEADARRTIVEATKKAEAVVGDVEQLRLQTFATLLKKVPDSTVRRFEDALEELLGAMERSR